MIFAITRVVNKDNGQVKMVVTGNSVIAVDSPVTLYKFYSNLSTAKLPHLLAQYYIF